MYKPNVMLFRIIEPFSARKGAYILIDSDDDVMILPKPITSDLMNIEPPRTTGSMKFDVSLLAVTDPVAVMLANPSAADDVLKGCFPASALST